MRNEILRRLLICASLFATFLLTGVFGDDTWALRTTAIVGMALSIGVFMVMRLDIQMMGIKDALIHSWERRNESQDEQIKALDEIIEDQNEMLAILRQERGRDPHRG